MKVVAVFSGGMDSSVMVHMLREAGHEVLLLSFDYGQRHKVELVHAANHARELGLQHRVIDLSSLRPLLAGSALTDNVEVPSGHYEEPSMKATVVPNRNMLMLSIAIAWAVSLEADAVAFGAHGGDHAIYPDCRPEFVVAMAKVAALANWHAVEVLAPLLDMDKGQVAATGAALGVDFSLTWTCYDPQEIDASGTSPGAFIGGGLAESRLHCGVCGACTERREAFDLAGVEDPTLYA